ncbi:MAG: peptide-binding protein, partial [bacterium]
MTIICIILISSGCTPQKNISEPRRPHYPNSSQADTAGTLVLSLLGDISMLNPALSSDSSSSSVEGLIFNGLISIDQNLEIIPDLARRWDVSADGKTWTFYLRRD